MMPYPVIGDVVFAVAQATETGRWHVLVTISEVDGPEIFKSYSADSFETEDEAQDAAWDDYQKLVDSISVRKDAVILKTWVEEQ